MKRSTIAIGFLSLALVASNAWWFYHAIDAGITAAYRRDAFDDTAEALAQSLAVARVASGPDATRSSIVAAASKAARHSDSFEKDGALWIGQLGLRFNESGRLLSIATASDPKQ